MRGLIIGRGEVGAALLEVLRGHSFYQVNAWDIKDGGKPEFVKDLDVLHICFPWSDDFCGQVLELAKNLRPKMVDVLSTVPPGTCEKIQTLIQNTHDYAHTCPVAKSSVRGLHPNLARSMRTFVKHIGGDCAFELAKYYAKSGIKTEITANAAAVELAHILSNTDYGVALLKAEENSRLCRVYGVDYLSTVHYNRTSNQGFAAMGHDSKMRFLLTNPGPSGIGGHCVVENAQLIPKEIRGPLMERLAASK